MQREKQTFSCREPDVGLHPRTPESRPEPKAGAQPLSHPGAPTHRFSENTTQPITPGSGLGIKVRLLDISIHATQWFHLLG